MNDDDVNRKARLAFVLVLAVLVAAGVGWYWVSLNRHTLYQINTRDSVSGLVADAPVEFHGVEVGKVDEIDLVDGHSIRVLLRIKKGTPVSTATVATITSRGLAARGFTGYVYVALDDRGTDTRKLVPQPGQLYPVIPTAPSKSVSLDETLSEVHDNVQFITALLRSLFDEKTVAALQHSAEGLQQITRTLSENNTKLSAIIANTEQASSEFKLLVDRKTVTAIQQSVDSLQQVSRTLADDNNKLRAIIANTERASVEFKPLLESTNSTVKELQTQLLPEAHKALTDLNSLSGSLRGITAKINRDPSILIRGTTRPAPGPGENR